MSTLSYNTQVRLENAVNSFVEDRKMFTAGEIIAHVRSQTPTVPERYGPMRDHIHSLYYSGLMGDDYEKTSVAFPASKGIESAFVYHPDNVDPAKYESHETRKTFTVPNSGLNLPTTGLVAIASPANQGNDLFANLLSNSFPGGSTLRSTSFTVTSASNAGNLNAVPLRKPNSTLTGAPEIVYSIDAAGHIVIGKDYTSQLVNSHLASLYALAEHKRVTLVSAADSFSANVAILSLDDNWNVRIPQRSLSKAGLEGKRLTITVEDDAIYVTERK